MMPLFKAIGIERLRVARDGDGITTLAAAWGCPLRCAYCLNPQCFERDKPVCEETPLSLLEKVRIDDLYFQATGGGVVFGGGEPLLYADFIHRFKQICPAQWKLGLETSLNVPSSCLEKVLEDIDFYLVDIKDMNPEIYALYTGRDPGDCLLNLQLLSAQKKQDRVCIRVPLIPDYNTPRDQEASIRILREMGFTRFERFTYDKNRALSKRRGAEKVEKIGG